MLLIFVFQSLACFHGIQGFLFETTDVHQVDATADTDCGRVRGNWSRNDGAISFLGIPYAEPPVGNLRWRPPVPIRKNRNNCWSDTLLAEQFGSKCVQRDPDNSSKTVGSEDCLFLNVFTPTLNTSAELPVMFWIHGGGLTSGTGSEPGYSPTAALAKSLNVVFVSINYRLNAFGFMALEWLKGGSSTNTSGNYGFMDAIQGLHWVQENIKNFGGNPQDVTVFGQSSGGTVVVALLASPLCKGLFHKAWMLSASPVLNKTASDAFKDNEVFVKNTGCGDVHCLYNLSASEVTSSVPWDIYPYWGMEDLIELPEKGKFDGALAIVDGYVLTESPFEAWINGNGVDVPVLVGTTAQETDIGLFYQGISNWTWGTKEYKDHVTQKLNSFSESLALTAANLYPENVSTPEFQFTSMVTDVRVTCGNDYLATVLAAGFTSPVYRYVATYYTKNHDSTFAYGDIQSNYAFHGIDIYAFFNEMASAMTDTPGPADNAWKDNVQREAVNFVTMGKPATAEWLRYPGTTAELDTDTKVFRGYHTSQCQFWLKNGFFAYSWIN
ncbi:para-nitrobenzyl esterase-like [Mercenaria mercenaria]|uniref:para-nitrobenzyl esterase-like n=1 Tax=Mercenaria mercenaria TaxID=6596 RepID=UPI00234E5732|nr:para-nitrobenzyl esterase-like [Mercenaria mercenaria]